MAVTVPTSRSEEALRAALARIRSGVPFRTDGRLTVTALAQEAGVSRATAYRHRNLIAEVRDETGASPQAPASASTLDDDTQARLERLSKEVALLRAEKTALANALYALTVEHEHAMRIGRG